MADVTKTTPEDTRVDETVETGRPVEPEPQATAEPSSGIPAARERFGGLDIPAGIVGAVTALASAAILAGLVTAVIGTIGSPDNLTRNAEELPTWSLFAGVAVLFVAYLIGGWVAGRMARYDGARNGFATGIWTLLIVGLLAAIGAWIDVEYNGLFHIERPQWLAWDALTWESLVGAGAAILAIFVGGTIGGMWGERFHRRVDRTVVAPPPSEETA
jgi:hypothetical protein